MDGKGNALTPNGSFILEQKAPCAPSLAVVAAVQVKPHGMIGLWRHKDGRPVSTAVGLKIEPELPVVFIMQTSCAADAEPFSSGGALGQLISSIHPYPTLLIDLQQTSRSAVAYFGQQTVYARMSDKEKPQRVAGIREKRHGLI